MGEIQRRTAQREIVISMGHLQAAGVAALLLTVTAFGVGFGLGRSGASAVVQAAPVRMLDGVPGEGLVELLAEVERGKVAHTSSAVRYPDWVDGDGSLGVPTEVPPVPGADALVQPPQGFAEPEGEAGVPGAFTVEVAEVGSAAEASALRDLLRAQGLAAWSGARRTGGEPRWFVRVGGFRTAAEATAALASVRSAAGSASAEARVVGLGVRPEVPAPVEAVAVPPAAPEIPAP